MTALKLRRGHQQGYHPDPQDLYPIEEFTDQPAPDFTMSQTTSYPSHQNDSEFLKDAIPADIFSKKDLTLDKLPEIIDKDKASIFYEVLLRAQRGELKLLQDDPESFGPISIKQI